MVGGKPVSVPYILGNKLATLTIGAGHLFLMAFCGTHSQSLTFNELIKLWEGCATDRTQLGLD